MIDINELVLRIPGIGEEEARRLAAAVARRLADRIPDLAASQTIDRLHIRLDLSAGLGREQLAERIAEAIWRDIRGRVR